MTMIDKFLIHYGKKGMKWGVINEEEEAHRQQEARSAKTSQRQPKKAPTTGPTGGGSGSTAASSSALANAKTPQELYNATFAAALGEPPVTPEKILEAQKQAEKAQRAMAKEQKEKLYADSFQAALAGADPPYTPEQIEAAQEAADKALKDAAAAERAARGILPKEKKAGAAKGKSGSSLKDKEKAEDEEPSANKEKAAKKEKTSKKEEDQSEDDSDPEVEADPAVAAQKREVLAGERSAVAITAMSIAEKMDGLGRTPEILRAEAEGIAGMLKMVVNDNETYTKLQEIGGRALSESKGGPQRTREQLQEDTAFMAELSKRFSDEANLMRNITEKDKSVKHSSTDEFLSHWGVKGMKWGVRKDRESAGKSAAPKPASAKTLSDKELADTVKRLNLEKQYKELTSTPENQTAVAKGTKLVGKVLVNNGQKVVDKIMQKKITDMAKKKGWL